VSDLLLQDRSAGRFTVLLWTLPCLLVFSQLSGDAAGWRFLIDLLVSLVLIIGVKTAGLSRSGQIAAWLLAGLAIVARWAHLVFHDYRLEIAGSILAASFMIVVGGALLLYVLHASGIGTDAVSAALCVYFLIGLIFGLLYSAIESISPGSFLTNAPPALDPLNASIPRSIRNADFVYFSMVAMTSTGFGDILPISRLARALAVVEILIGQLYLVVMIARLVSLWHQPIRSQ
jgi:hypothetical protein